MMPGAGESGLGGGSEALGVYQVKLGVTDGQGGHAEQDFSIRVSPEPGNASPVITSDPDLSGFKNRFYSYDVDASDADGEDLSYSLIEAPAGISIDEITGKISWQSPEVGTYTIKVRVVDQSGGLDIQTYTLEVLDVQQGTVRGNVYLDENGDGVRTLVNPNNLTPDEQIQVGDRFKDKYTVYDLGIIPGSQYGLGGMTFYKDPVTGVVDTDTMLMVSSAEGCGTVLVKVKVHRGENGHIIGFDDDGYVETPSVPDKKLEVVGRTRFDGSYYVPCHLVP
jgi:hypothetical protein